jgi:hypothetical protein
MASGTRAYPIRRGIPVQVDAIGTIISLTAVGSVLLTTVMSRRQRPVRVEAAAANEE